MAIIFMPFLVVLVCWAYFLIGIAVPTRCTVNASRAIRVKNAMSVKTTSMETLHDPETDVAHVNATGTSIFH